MARLVDWSEKHGLRSPSQAGFRPGRSTVHHLFALRHFIDHARLAKRALYTCFVDLQKAYDTVQHELLWGRLRQIGVSPRMLAAVQSLYATGTLAMKIDGTAGQPAVQHMGVRQGCPLSPTLFGIFFDGLHDFLLAWAPAVGMRLRSGRWVSSLVYADDVVLLSWTSHGLQHLIDGMHQFCLGMGLTISPTKTEVVVFHPQPLDSQLTWHVGGKLLPVSPSFKYLGLIFDQSGDMVPAFKRLLQNGNGAKATLIAKFKRLHCNQSFPMMRRLFDAVVKPTVSYGCEVWGTLCSGSLQPGLKGMAGLQIAFFRQILKLRKSISPHVIFAELAEAPWQRTWWSQVLRFMHRLDSMDEGSLHPDILSDNIHDALGNPRCCNWAAGVQKQFASLGVPSPFSGGRIRNVDHLAFRKAMLARDMSVWGGLHISPRGAPSKGAKLCTYLRWFARPDKTSTEPYYELPLPVTKLRSIFHFRVGAHSLPVEQGRIAMPKVPRHLRRCTFCATNAIGDERHCLFDCPHFQGLRQQHAEIFRDSHDAMRSVMWHKDQQSVCALVLAIVNEAQTL